MTLTPIQREILSAIAKNRSAESYVAGGAALNRNRPRLSDDLDIFTDRADLIADTVKRDIALLEGAGFEIFGEISHYGLVTEAVVSRGGVQSRIQWMDETRRRFCPLVADAAFGVRLHDADLAVNKVHCASSRIEARDFVDLAELQQSYCPLGALIWAATAKVPMGPGQIIAQIRRNAGEVSADQIAAVRTAATPYVRQSIMSALSTGLSRAEAYVLRAPVDTLGRLLTRNGVPTEADARMIAGGGVKILELTEFDDIIPEVSA